MCPFSTASDAAFVEFSLSTAPPVHFFSSVSICKYYPFMDDFYLTIFARKRLDNAAFLTELFIRTNKDPKFVPFKHSIGTL